MSLDKEIKRKKKKKKGESREKGKIPLCPLARALAFNLVKPVNFGIQYIYTTLLLPYPIKL